MFLLLALLLAQATPVQQSPTDLKAAQYVATATSAGNVVSTATINAANGQCIYVTDVLITMAANAAVTGAAGPLPIFTSSGLSVNLIWWGDNGTYVAGQQKTITDKHYVNPIKVPQSTAFSIASSGTGQATYNTRVTIMGYTASCG